MTPSVHPRIAVDATGGDFGPSVVVPGAVDAARQLEGRATVVCVGDESAVRAALATSSAAEGLVEVVHAPRNIEMGESPATAIRRKPDSSIAVGARLMKEGAVDAFVSAGSTGAMTAAGTLIVGRLPGVDRPGIAAILPTLKGACLLLDVGANADCKPQHLLQFAAMGRIYARHVLGMSEVTVGLLNIGEEPTKGNELTLEAHELLAAHEPAFVGNIEGRHLLEGQATVVVTDGFVGNVVLKVLEGTRGILSGMVRDELRRDPRALLGAWLMKPSLKRVFKRFDYAEYGGAPLLGCRGGLVICHGSSSSLAITNAVKVADRGVRDRVSQRIQDEVERERREIEATRAAAPAPETQSGEGA